MEELSVQKFIKTNAVKQRQNQIDPVSLVCRTRNKFCRF